MPNHWMDQIIQIYDDCHSDKITIAQLVNKVEQVMIDYKTEFKKYDDAIVYWKKIEYQQPEYLGLVIQKIISVYENVI